MNAAAHLRVLAAVTFSIVLCASAPAHGADPVTRSGDQDCSAVTDRPELSATLERADTRLEATFARRAVPFPPHAIVLVALKREGRLELWSRAEGSGPWTFVRSYLIRAVSGRLGPKLRQGDHQVPEGFYRVTALNPKSNFHLSLRLNYPNELDRARAQAEKRLRLGGDIMIHGGAASDGCLAVGDEAAEELFVLGLRVGVEHVSVIISPVDLRTLDVARALARVHSPAPWLEEHYLAIAHELQRFPMPDFAHAPALPVRPIARRARCKPYDLGDCSRRCAKGEGSSCARAGLMYRDGRGVAVDPAKAWSLLGSACGAGDALGCAELSRLYLADDGTRRDVARAAELARAACDGGDGHGCAYLAAICVDGLLYPEPLEVCSRESVDRMRRRAVELLDTRCKGWGAYDCATLATIYADGDLVTARRFASGACDGGEPKGCSELHRFTDTSRLVAFRTASDRCTAPEGRRDHDRDRRSRLD